MGAFQTPAFYEYPPYFTLQPVAATRAKQSASWRKLILEYCEFHKVGTVATDGADAFPLFENRRIGRALSGEARREFLEDLVRDGHGLWEDKAKTRCLVLWLRVSELGQAVMDWAEQNGFRDSVFTVVELVAGEDTKDAPFWGVPRRAMEKALDRLEDRGKVRLFQGDTGDDLGVKIL